MPSIDPCTCINVIPSKWDTSLACTSYNLGITVSMFCLNVKSIIKADSGNEGRS